MDGSSRSIRVATPVGGIRRGPPRSIRMAAPAGGGGRGQTDCYDGGLGLFRGVALAAVFSAAFWPGVVLLARAVW